jgi:hypothetical protein
MTQLHLFKRFIGIDYSGAKTPTSHLTGLQIFMATLGKEPKKIQPNNEKGVSP